ncbi:hypothetical protein BU25DRAFT_270870 [Macroventuria anomochaeta]|uniref:Uncharacterized protein n=1 Tax=Macroventuria anomochaeta TaxID=301207 RepID=A0ACB6S6M6_9PLEO|nr:uncharacterized protein BU25DRAFT_270870 [Macroventuria anomochaeta]KAF2629623.1 hypothetical protein BU25DRAFT_270870 [Macroventuria anomochaeta]
MASTLCSAREGSNEEYKELWHFNSKADMFPTYLQEKYLELAKKKKKKTSYLYTGFFFYKLAIPAGTMVCKATRRLNTNAIPNISQHASPTSRSTKRHMPMDPCITPATAQLDPHG